MVNLGDGDGLAAKKEDDTSQEVHGGDRRIIYKNLRVGYSQHQHDSVLVNCWSASDENFLPVGKA